MRYLGIATTVMLASLDTVSLGAIDIFTRRI